jgi:hypothetical protein
MGKYLDKLVVSLFLATALQLHGQGYVYDQQSDSTPENINYDSFVINRLMLMQAFVPTLSSIDFVQLEISDYPDSSTSGATLSVALYSGSPQYPTSIGGTERVDLPANFHNDGIAYSGVATFYFETPITLTPGQTYYIDPVEITGDHVWSVAVTENTYPNGKLYAGGAPITPTTDLWFREGIETVPEPSDLALWAMGGVLMVRFFKEMPPLAKPTANTI